MRTSASPCIRAEAHLPPRHNLYPRQPGRKATSGDKSRNKGISKAGCKLARSTLVELAWSWLRYQHDSALAVWWRARFSKRGMRIRNIGIVALARKLAVAFWQFIEDGQVPKGAVLKA